MAGNCPSGGLWYSCTDQNPTFFGCCTSNPCNGHGCPSSDLRPAGLDSGGKSMYPNVSCASGGEWYTCSETHPTFQGCCTMDACAAQRCPPDSLRMASFGEDVGGKGEDDHGKGDDNKGGSNTQIYTITPRESIGGESKPTTVVLTSTLLTQPTSNTTPTPSPSHKSENPPDPHHNAGAVAGIAVGAVAGVAFIGALVYGWTWLQKRRRKKGRNPTLSGGPGAGGLGGNVIINVGERRQESSDERIHRSYLEKLERDG